MARKPTVNLTDTFETFRQKTNLISSNVGDPDNLTTPVTTDLVQALNEVNSRTTQSFIRNSVSLNASNNAPHSSLSYSPATGVFTFSSNTIRDSDIPTLDASKVGTGVFNAQLIPGLDACMIITGVLDSARMPVGYFDKEFLQNTTDDLQEGSSNLYYTNQRVYAAIGTYPGDSSLDYNTATGQFRVNMNNIINNINNNISPAGIDSAKAQAITLNLIDSAYINARVDPDSGGIALTDLAVITNAASGGGSLTYNNGTGNFTFEPADLSSVAATKVYRQDVTIAVPANSATYRWNASNFPTGISRRPDDIQLKIICTSADGGYSVGDVIYIGTSNNDPYGKNEGVAVAYDVSNNDVLVPIGNNGVAAPTRRTGGNHFIASGTKWSVNVSLFWYGTDANEDIDTTGTMTQL